MSQDNQREATLYAYLAGIIDGEGTIRIGKSNPKRKGLSPTYYASISAGMTEKKVISLLSKVFGSKVHIRIECVPGRKLIYRWGTSGNIAVPRIIKKILPYLIVKRKQAEFVLEFCEKKIRIKKKCRICGSTDIQGHSLCGYHYHRLLRLGELEKWKNIKPAKMLSSQELQRREELYQMVRKLNAVGAPATTKRDDTREGEAIV